MSDKQRYGVIVIGGGPGGYVAALKAARMGLDTACIEKHSRLGGVCLNIGCIPSKALLDSSEFFHLAKEGLKEHGVITGEINLDLKAMMDRKDKVVSDLTDNVKNLLERHKVKIIRGTARLTGGHSVVVKSDSDEKDTRTFEADSIILATGSRPVEIPALKFDGKMVVSSTEALTFSSVPERLGIVGGGYIGLELGSVWNRLGSEITVIEMLSGIATNLDGQIARRLQRILTNQGIIFRLKTKVIDAKVSGETVKVTVEKGEDQETLEFDRLLVAVGRKPFTDGLGLDEVGIETDKENGHVVIDEKFQTSVNSVYAIGDLVPGPMLAHKASAEGIAAVENIAGFSGEVNYDAVPAVIYTWPEVASVGITEEQAKQREIPYVSGTFPFTGNGRAKCLGETDGFVKILAHKKTDRILGVHIVGPRASDMIAECVLAIEFGAGAEDLARTMHAHPSMSETLWETAMAIGEK